MTRPERSVKAEVFALSPADAVLNFAKADLYLGAGFSRAISEHMPLMKEVGSTDACVICTQNA
jgi:hypothetical protein